MTNGIMPDGIPFGGRALMGERGRITVSQLCAKKRDDDIRILPAIAQVGATASLSMVMKRARRFM